MHFLKRAIVGTILEAPAKKIFYGIVERTRRRKAAPTLAGINEKYDKQTAAVMKRSLNSNSSCIDVGCHQGGTLKQSLSVAPNGTHYAFEPIPEFYSACVSSFGSFPNVKLRDLLNNLLGRQG